MCGEPCLEKERGCHAINLSAHLTLGQTLLAKHTLCLGATQTLVSKLVRQSTRPRDTLGLLANMTRLPSRGTSQRLGEPADKHLGLMVLHEHAPRSRVIKDVMCVHDTERGGNACRGIRDGDTDALLPYVESHDAHVH